MKVDERNAEDILVWGDFWVFNYNQVGDTLKCVSGGNHPGLMHISQTDNGFKVTAFEQVEDGSRNLPTAKKIFGEKFDAFQAIHSDEQKREKLRADVLTYQKPKIMKQNNVKPAEGKLGILVVGNGAVATTFMTGVLMTRKGLTKPIGSMTQYDKIRVGKGADKKYLHYKDIVPMTDLNDIVFGCWDVYPQR